MVLVLDTGTWFRLHTNPRPFEGEGFTYIPEKIRMGAIVPPIPHISDGPATLHWPTPSQFDFFFFCNFEVQFWRKTFVLVKEFVLPCSPYVFTENELRTFTNFLWAGN